MQIEAKPPSARRLISLALLRSRGVLVAWCSALRERLRTNYGGQRQLRASVGASSPCPWEWASMKPVSAERGDRLFPTMADQSTIDGLLEGAFDTHIHSAPDVLPRKFNDIELAQRFKARRMAGFVLKSHYICTADRATLVNQIVPEIQAFGAIALNNSVGGLNPLALDIAGRLAPESVGCRPSTTPTSSRTSPASATKPSCPTG